MVLGENLFQVEPTTVTIFSKLTQKIDVEIRVNAQWVQSNTCAPDKCTGINLDSQELIKKERHTSIKEQRLPRLLTATKKPTPTRRDHYVV